MLHDTYYVVGHFHYVLMGAIAFAGFAGIYYWFPLVTERMYQASLGKAHFWLSMVGSNITFLAMILLGYGGMPRRYATYLPEFATLHQVATVGALLLLVGQIIWLYNMVSSWFEGKRVDDADPWNLSQDNVRTIEWQWFEQKLDTQLATDGGDEEVATDGGEPADGDDE